MPKSPNKSRFFSANSDGCAGTNVNVNVVVNEHQDKESSQCGCLEPIIYLAKQVIKFIP